MAIYTDGIMVTTDTTLAELQAFAKSIELPASCMRATRWMVSYELRDASDREKVRRTGATWVRSRRELWKVWQERKR